MRAGARPGIGQGELVLLLAQVGDQLLRVAGRQVGAGDHGHRHVGDPADRGEGGGRVVGQLAVERAAGGLADMVHQDGVAVGVGLGDAGGAQGTAGAADILDDHLLAQGLGHRLGDQAADRVGGAAGGERDDHGDRPLGIVGPGEADAAGEQNRGEQKGSAHDTSSVLGVRGGWGEALASPGERTRGSARPARASPAARPCRRRRRPRARSGSRRGPGTA